MRIVALKYGESVFGENYIFKGGNKDKYLPISFTIYLIQTKDKNILKLLTIPKFIKVMLKINYLRKDLVR